MSTDCKPHEVVKFLVGDINLGKRTALIKVNKNFRTITITEGVSEALSEYWSFRGWQQTDDPAFARHDRGSGKYHKPLTTRSIQNIVHQMCESGSDGRVITPSDLRIGYFIMLLDQPLDANHSNEAINIKAFQTTREYFRPG
jgi:integrase